MRVISLGAQLGLASEPAGWYRNATSVPHGHLLIELSPGTDDRSRYCTKTGSILATFYFPNRPKQSKFLDDEHTKSLDSPSVPIIFPQTQEPFPSGVPKTVYQVLLRMYIKCYQLKPAMQKKTSRDKKLKRSWTVFSKKNQLESKKGRSSIRKVLEVHKTHYSSRQ